MSEGSEGAPIPQEPIPDITNGDFGFHFTVDRGLRGAFQHGLLSRDEERRLGLATRIRASRSYSDTVYFTTKINDIYFRREHDLPLEDTLSDVVAIAINRPDFARARDGHFGMEDKVDPHNFKSLLFIDTHVSEMPKEQRQNSFDNYKVGMPLDEKIVADRVAFLRSQCEESGIDLPIYGISGNLYWPEQKSRGEIVRTNRQLRLDKFSE